MHGTQSIDVFSGQLLLLITCELRVPRAAPATHGPSRFVLEEGPTKKPGPKSGKFFLNRDIADAKGNRGGSNSFKDFFPIRFVYVLAIFLQNSRWIKVHIKQF